MANNGTSLLPGPLQSKIVIFGTLENTIVYHVPPHFDLIENAVTFNSLYTLD